MDGLRKTELRKFKIKKPRRGKPTSIKLKPQDFQASSLPALVAVRPLAQKVLQKTYNREDVEDAISIAMLRILNTYKDIGHESEHRLSGLLITSARNELKNQIRNTIQINKRKEQAKESYISLFDTVNVLDKLLTKARPSIIQLAKERLPPMQYTCVRALAEHDGLGKEIASKLDIDPNTFKTNYRIGIAKLRIIINTEKLDFTI